MISISVFWFIVIILGSFFFGWIVLCCLSYESFRSRIMGRRDKRDK